MLYYPYRMKIDVRGGSMSKDDPKPDDSKLIISFALGKNKSVVVNGNYNPTLASFEDRMEFLNIVQQFGQEISTELIENFKVKVLKVVLCEINPGHIMFEAETNANQAIRKKAILSIQKDFEDEILEDKKEDDFLKGDVKTKATESVKRKSKKQSTEFIEIDIPPNSWPMRGPSTKQ